MTSAQIASYRAALEQLRAASLAAGPARIEPNRKDPTTIGIPDEDEQALSEMLQMLASEKNKKQGELLGLIERALRKIEMSPDDFGLCEECEEEIPDKRLRLMPYVALCAECQASRDPQRGQGRRSLTDYR